MTMRKLLAALLCAMLILTTVGMGAMAEEKTYELTIWCFADTHRAYFDYITGEYTKLHPNVTFTVENCGGTAERDRLAIAAQAGGDGACDMADIEQGQWPSYMTEDTMYFEPIEDRLEADGLSDAMVQARLNLYQYEGHYYGLEHALCPVLMAYRPDLFEEAGVEVPTTWEEYKAAAYALKEKGIYISYVYDLHKGIGDIVSQITRSAHCDIVTEDGKFQLTDDYLAILEDVRTLAEDECLYVYEEGADYWYETSENHIATMFLADWACGWLRDNVPEQEGLWRMTAMPKYNEDSAPTSVSGGTGLCMVKFGDEDKKDVCWDFMKFAMLDPTNCVTKYEMVSLYPPVYAAMEACNTPVAYFGDQNLGEMWQEYAPETPIQYQARFRAIFDEIVAKYVYDYAEGDMTIEEFGDAIKADMAEYME